MNYEQDAEEILKELKTDNEEIKNKTIKILEICDKIEHLMDAVRNRENLSKTY